MQGAFEYFDGEKKGFIDENSMIEALKYHNLFLNEDEIRKCFAKRKQISFKELEEMFEDSIE